MRNKTDSNKINAKKYATNDLAIIEFSFKLFCFSFCYSQRTFKKEKTFIKAERNCQAFIYNIY